MISITTEAVAVTWMSNCQNYLSLNNILPQPDPILSSTTLDKESYFKSHQEFSGKEQRIVEYTRPISPPRANLLSNGEYRTLPTIYHRLFFQLKACWREDSEDYGRLLYEYLDVL